MAVKLAQILHPALVSCNRFQTSLQPVHAEETANKGKISHADDSRWGQKQ